MSQSGQYAHDHRQWNHLHGQHGTFARNSDLYGEAGDDNITVQSSVNILDTAVWRDGQQHHRRGRLGPKVTSLRWAPGNDNVTGNGLNTSFWVDPSDTVHATPTETAGGDVHRVASFYQPFSSNPANPNYVPTALGISNLADPTDSGATTRLNNVLWGAGPSMTDVNQGQVGDCYYLASIQSLALKQPGKLQEMAVDLGDGTYAVQFKRGGTTTYVRVDADMPVANWGGLLCDSPSNGGPMCESYHHGKSVCLLPHGSEHLCLAELEVDWEVPQLSDLGISTTTFTTQDRPRSLTPSPPPWPTARRWPRSPIAISWAMPP